MILYSVHNGLVSCINEKQLSCRCSETEHRLEKYSCVIKTNLKKSELVNGRVICQNSLENNLGPNEVISALKSCAKEKDLNEGIKIHANIVNVGLLGKYNYIDNAIINMYAKCGALEEAKQVFESIPVQDVVSWNVLISGHAQSGHGKEALKLLEQMHQSGLYPDGFTFSCILQACGSVRSIRKGEEIHGEIVRLGLFGSDVILGNALVDMYMRCGVLEDAQTTFDKLPVRNLVSWTTLIAGYAEGGHGEEALKCYDLMKKESFYPDQAAFVSALKACASIGAIEKGQEIHAEIVEQGLQRKGVIFGNALVDMYAKCGVLEKAHEVFEEVSVPNVVSWTALIAGYAQIGKNELVCNLFDKMIEESMQPDLITFTVVLNACSHSGLVEKGEMYFYLMTSRYGFTPTLEHYTCMVDLFGRMGHFDKAIEIIVKMPNPDHLPVWSSLLGACQKWGNIAVGKWAFEQAVKLDKKEAMSYICMRNIYIASQVQLNEETNDAIQKQEQSINLGFKRV